MTIKYHSEARKVFLLILATAFLGWFSGCNSQKSDSNENASGHQVTFICASGDSIRASFQHQSASIRLPNGRHLMLKRAISASGARYINEDSSVTFWNKGNTAFIREGDSTTYKNCVQNGHDDLVNLKSYQAHDLQFRYPKVLKLSKKAVKDTAGWSYESTAKGRLIAQFRFDTSAQPKTNLSAATFTIGRSKSAGAVQECMATPQGRMTRADSLKRSGITYVHSRYSDAGAGNYYEINRYRTLQANSCFSIEEMVHSTNIHNYPPERGITAYDSARVWKALDVAWQTFRFDR